MRTKGRTQTINRERFGLVAFKQNGWKILRVGTKIQLMKYLQLALEDKTTELNLTGDTNVMLIEVHKCYIYETQPMLTEVTPGELGF